MPESFSAPWRVPRGFPRELLEGSWAPLEVPGGFQGPPVGSWRVRASPGRSWKELGLLRELLEGLGEFQEPP